MLIITDYMILYLANADATFQNTYFEPRYSQQKYFADLPTYWK